MNPFEKLSGILKMNSAPSAVVGVDIGSSFVKAVQLKKKGSKAVLDTYGELALGPMAGLEIGQATNLPAEKIVEAINDLFKEANITSRDVVFSIPLTATMLSVIRLPDVGQAKLDQVVPIEARKYIPTSISEVTLNWWVVPKLARQYTDPDKTPDKNPQTDVLIAAIHNDIIAKYQTIAKSLKVNTAAFEVEIFSAIRSTMGHDNSLVMMMDIGAANTKIAMIEEGIVRSSHLINSGSQDITLALSRAKGYDMLKAEELKRDFGLHGDPSDKAMADIVRLSVERIFAEANRILLRYQEREHVKATKVILTGGGALLKGLSDIIKLSFETDVIFGHPFGKVETPAVLEPVLRDAGPEFSVAIGLALKKLQ
jgi:type IV pilus assembly protein PilM